MSLSALGLKSTQKQLMPTMANWRGVWDISGAYTYGDLVQGSDNNGYACMVANVGNDPVSGPAPSPWVSLAQSGASGGMNFATTWNAGSSYPTEDVVVGSNGATYVALSSNTGVNPVIDVSGALPAVSGTKWTRLSGANVVVPWSGSSQYGVGDMVQATQPNGQIGLFQAVVPNSNSAPTTGNSNWVGLADEIGSSMSYVGGWSNGTTYDKQDVVSYLGYGWVSQSNANSNNAPAFGSSNFWVPLAGSESITEVHHKKIPNGSNVFYLQTSNVASNTWIPLVSFPNTAVNGEQGTFVFGSVFSIGGSNATTASLQVSDLSGASPSSNAVYSTIATAPAGAGATFHPGGTMTYAFSNAPNTLWLNLLSPDQDMTGYTPTAYTGQYYEYTNTIVPVNFINDP